MDLKQGYHQLVLHPDSRALATISTAWGNMRPKILIFGAKSSQDLFDEAMYEGLDGGWGWGSGIHYSLRI